MPEPRVWIAQCLCPERHCILAAVDVAEDRRAAVMRISEPLRKAVHEGVSSGVMNPWCGLCGARRETWSIDLGRTAWSTLEEALPMIRQLEQQQAVTRALYGDLQRGRPN